MHKKTQNSSQGNSNKLVQSQLQIRSFAVQPQIETQSQQDKKPELQSDDEKIQRSSINLMDIMMAANPPQIQPKLEIGAVGDKYEQEADHVASQVVSQINKPVQKKLQRLSETEVIQRKSAIASQQPKSFVKPLQRLSKEEITQRKEVISSQQPKKGFIKPFNIKSQDQSVQRQEAIRGGTASVDLESAIQEARGGGQSLDPNLQQSMGTAMGADFSSVKVHTDSQSDQLNKSIQAKAFTTGQDVFFRQGAYDPSSRDGQELIAHELTHVVQQNGNSISTSSTVQRKMFFDPKCLAGKLTHKAKLKGLSKPSTFSLIKAKLDQYMTASGLIAEKNLLKELEILAKEWIRKHQNSTEPNDWIKKMSLDMMLLAISQEIKKLDTKIADDDQYLSDIKNQKFKFLTNEGATASDTTNQEFNNAARTETSQKSGLTKAELAAIRVYTAADFLYLNPILAKNKGWLDSKIKEMVAARMIDLGGRDKLDDSERLQIEQEAMRHVNKSVEGLAKLPDIHTTVYRGIGLSDKDFADQYQKDKTLTFAAFTSTSKTISTAQQFANMNSGSGNVGIIAIMQVTKGKDIDPLSANPGEKEVLLAPYSKFKINDILDKGNKVYEVKMTQII